MRCARFSSLWHRSGWLHARRGRLESYEPHTYAAAITQEKIRLRFPLVLYNTGAIPIVVQNLRLRFPEELASAQLLPWVVSWPQIKPDKDDQYSFRAVFSVAGRTAHQMFPEFGASSLGFTLEARDYPALIEAKLGHKKEWRPLLKFTFRAGHIVDPSHFITYDNTPGNLSEEHRQRAEVALRQLAQELAGEQKGEWPYG
ncbi:MAG: hypothetical protein LC775_15380 [Acidobacteria bacterium]|nr:hypothetical protein [Acidobacteriota bacterium]